MFSSVFPRSNLQVSAASVLHLAGLLPSLSVPHPIGVVPSLAALDMALALMMALLTACRIRTFHLLSQYGTLVMWYLFVK